MPIYDFECRDCCNKFDRYLPLVECEEAQACPVCHGPCAKLISAHVVKVFNPQFVHIATGGERDEKPVYVRNTKELKDALYRHNDSLEAQIHGKVSVHEKLSVREV